MVPTTVDGTVELAETLKVNLTAARSLPYSQLGLDIDGAAAGDFSGWSVALSGDGNTLVVGAWNNDGNGSWAEQARVYRAAGLEISDGQGVGTILNDDTAAISIGDLSKLEGDGGTTAFKFTLEMDHAASKNVTVDVALAAVGDTAVAGTDYSDFGTQTVTFLPGQTSQTVTVNVYGDKIVEADKTFTLSLVAGSAQFNNASDASRAVIAGGDLLGNASGDHSIASGFIINDDSAEFTINSVSGAEADGAMTFTVTLSQPVDVATSVDVTLANVTTSGGDHGGTSLTTLNFAAGETSQTFTVTPVDDAIVEADETFEITPVNLVDGGRSVTAAVLPGSGTIRNDPTDNVFWGTGGNDIFAFTVSNQFVVNVNGAEYRLDPTLVDRIIIRGLGGEDAIVLHGGANNETAWIRVGSVRMSGPFYHVAAGSVEDIRVNAGGGVNDRAFLYDSPGDDTFLGTPDFSQLRGDGFSSLARGFDRVIAVASSDLGGLGDRAILRGSAGNDLFIGTETSGRLSGSGFYNVARGFDGVLAHALGGKGKAFLFDSSGDDMFIGREAFGRMSGTGFFNQANGFDSVHTFATDGNDKAFLFDSSGDNLFDGRTDYGRLSGLGFLNYARGFDFIRADGTAGGTDRLNVSGILSYALTANGWEVVV